MQRKGQAAMEFLMTYGWAILAAIIAIGVLAYFGVFSPGRFVAGAATINAPFGIDAHNILATGGVDGSINFDMVQNSGQTLNNVIVTVTGTGASSAITCTSAEIDGWLTGTERPSVALSCDDGGAGDSMAAGESFSGNIAVTYNAGDSAIAQQATGSIRNTIQ